MPAALTEFLGTTVRRFRANLNGLTKFALEIEPTIAGIAGSKLGLQYSLDNGTTWKGMDMIYVKSATTTHANIIDNTYYTYSLAH